MADEIVTAQTYHSLSAGMTTIMENGNVLTFGGPIRKGEGFTSVGQGSISTTDAAEIAWLDGLCAMRTPQVWKEVPADDVTAIPSAVASGTVADAVTVVSELADSAATAAVADAKSGGSTGSTQMTATDMAANLMAANAGK